jgi:hypothetical protein
MYLGCTSQALRTNPRSSQAPSLHVPPTRPLEVNLLNPTADRTARRACARFPDAEILVRPTDTGAIALAREPDGWVQIIRSEGSEELIVGHDGVILGHLETIRDYLREEAS